MTRNYENCSICGKRRRVSESCPRCGYRQHSRTGQNNHAPEGGGQMREAMLKALKEKDKKARPFGRKTPKGTRSPARRQEKREVLQSRVSTTRNQSGKATVSHWSSVQEDNQPRISPSARAAEKTDHGEPMRSNSSSQPRQTPRTQVRAEPGGEEREVVVGLDFGTACTKVTIGDDAIGEVYAVPFGSLAHKGHPYLLATRIYADHDGRLSLQDGALKIDDLKIKLLAGPNNGVFSSNETNANASALDICTGYLALVLREVLNWFLNNHGASYRDCTLIWQVNIGVPSRSYDNKSQLATYRTLALSAWRAAVQDEPVTIESSRIAVAKCRQILGGPKTQQDIATTGPYLHPEDVGVIPEVIAEVVAYARSDLRREGTHLLVDVGASTLDVATFVLHTKDGDDQFSLLTTEVQKLGAYVLHRQRISVVAEQAEANLTKILEQADGISPLPALASYLPVDAKTLESIDQPFRAQCHRLVSKTVRETRIHRNAKAYVWDKGGELPVFICGGGRSLPVYVESVRSAVESVAPHTHADLLSLPKPNNFRADDLALDEYDRLAVACGLSTRQDRIGEVIPPAAIEDLGREVRKTDYSDRFVGKEMV